MNYLTKIKVTFNTGKSVTMRENKNLNTKEAIEQHIKQILQLNFKQLKMNLSDVKNYTTERFEVMKKGNYCPVSNEYRTSLKPIV